MTPRREFSCGDTLALSFPRSRPNRFLAFAGRIIAAWLIVTAVLGPSMPAVAAEEAIQVGSLTLEIVKLGDYRRQARIGDVVVAENFYVHAQRAFSAGRAGAVVLEVADGGKSCAALYKIVSVAASGHISSTDEFGDCFAVSSITGDAGQLSLQFDPAAGLNGWLYHWTASGGLEEPGEIVFAPKAGTGWAHARDLIGRHPSLIFENEEISKALRMLLGEDFDALRYDILVASEMEEVAPDMIIGQGCLPQACANAEALVALDARHRRVYVAISDEKGGLRIYPAEAKWPHALRTSLLLWRAAFM
jgi:hypothetical protein